MPYYYTYSTIINSIVSIHIKERRLQNSRREDNFIHHRTIVSIHRLWVHKPFCTIYWFTQLRHGIHELEHLPVADVLHVAVARDAKIRIIAPLVRITNLYRNSIQLFLRLLLRFSAHPWQLCHTLTVRSTKVLNQCKHTLLSLRRKVLCNISLPYYLSQHTLCGSHYTTPTWALHLLP